MVTGVDLMETTKRKNKWENGRRRRAVPLLAEPDFDAHAAISPVWEVQPRGHREVGARASVVRRDGQLRRGLAAADVVAAFASLFVVTRFVDPGSVRLGLTSLLLAPFVLLVGKLVGLYDRDPHVLHKTTLDEAPSIGYLSVIFALGVWLCEAALMDGALDRPQVFALLVLMFMTTTAGRLIVRRLAFVLAPTERCIVIGNATDAARVATKFALSQSVNAEVIGRVALHLDRRSEDMGAIPKLGEYAELSRVVARYQVERAIISQTDEQDQLLDAIRLIKALGIKVSVLPRLLEVVGSTSTFDEIDGLWLLGVRQFGLARSSEMIKRAADIAVAVAALTILGPLFLMLMLAVKLDSDGPTFFRQARIGRRGERFWMLKFRSMVSDAEAQKAGLQGLNEAQGGLFKITSDPRITRVGRFIRRTSLDELPQLINVVRGDMSLVGPRPLVPDEDSLVVGWQRRRLSVRPGMTGLWQIFGSSRIPMDEMVKIDYIYGANWSLWLDLRILLRTVPYMLSRSGR